MQELSVVYLGQSLVYLGQLLVYLGHLLVYLGHFPDRSRGRQASPEEYSRGTSAPCRYIFSS